MHTALLGLGANLGDRKATLAAALEQLAATAEIRNVIASSFLETASVGGPSEQPPFLNAAAVVQTSLAAEPLWERLQKIERELGRVREIAWGARTIDLDILLFDEDQIDLPRLIVPHRFFPFRRFELEPASEIAPHLRHPVLRWTVQQCFDHLRLAAPHFEIWSVLAAPAETLRSVVTKRFPEARCTLRSWESLRILDVEAAAPPKARFVLDPQPDTLWFPQQRGPVALHDRQAVAMVEMLVLLEQLPRVPQLQLPACFATACREVLGAVEAMQ